MKKIIVSILCFVMALSMVACGSKKPAPPLIQEKPSPSPDVMVEAPEVEDNFTNQSNLPITYGEIIEISEDGTYCYAKTLEYEKIKFYMMKGSHIVDVNAGDKVLFTYYDGVSYDKEKEEYYTDLITYEKTDKEYTALTGEITELRENSYVLKLEDEVEIEVFVNAFNENDEYAKGDFVYAIVEKEFKETYPLQTNAVSISKMAMGYSEGESGNIVAGEAVSGESVSTTTSTTSTITSETEGSNSTDVNSATSTTTKEN